MSRQRALCDKLFERICWTVVISSFNHIRVAEERKNLQALKAGTATGRAHREASPQRGGGCKPYSPGPCMSAQFCIEILQVICTGRGSAKALAASQHGGWRPRLRREEGPEWLQDGGNGTCRLSWQHWPCVHKLLCSSWAQFGPGTKLQNKKITVSAQCRSRTLHIRRPSPLLKSPQTTHAMQKQCLTSQCDSLKLAPLDGQRNRGSLQQSLYN